MAQRGSTSKPTRFKGPLVVTLRGAGASGNDPLTKGAGGDVGLDIQAPTGQTANIFQITKPDGTVLYSIGASGSPTGTFADGLTAHAGGTQAAALALTASSDRITVVATAGDSVALPAATAGRVVTLINSGANAMQVFGTTPDTINGIATAVGISQGPGTQIQYRCVTAGAWFSDAVSQLTFSPQVIGASGAVGPHAAATYLITKAGVAALTLAAPTVTVDDGLIVTISSTTLFAHTLTATGLLSTGAAAVNLATFAAFAGAGLTLMAYQGKWIVLFSIGVTFS